MTKDTKFNLILIVILVVGSAPGAYRLFMKKLNPDSAPLYLPEPVRQTVVYFERGDFSPTIRRMVPPGVLAMTERLVQSRAGADQSLWMDDQSDRRTPVMSERRRFQVLWVGTREGQRRALVLVWGEDPTDPSGFHVEPGEILEVVPVDTPAAVVMEMRDAGMVRPPRVSTLLDLTLPREARALNVRRPTREPWQDTAPLP